jgi:hypothetical protein
MNNKFQQLHGENDVIFLDNTVFNAFQIINKIMQDFEPKGNDLNFCRKNLLLKKYFKQRNIQGIFNRVEWKFSLKKGISCELLIPGKNSKRRGRLEIKVILEFSPSRELIPSVINGSISNPLPNGDSQMSKNFDIKVSLDFCPEEAEVQERPSPNDSKSYLNDIALINHS